MRNHYSYLILSALSAGLGLASCGLIDPGIIDTDITLKEQIYRQSLGSSMGEVPSFSCSSQADLCQEVATAFKNGQQLTARCDPAARTCYGEVSFSLPYTVDLSSEPGFVGKVVRVVQKFEIAYSNAGSTVNTRIPKVDLYIGPESAMTKDDAGALYLGSVGPFPPDRTTAGKLSVQSGTPAYEQMVKNVQNPKVKFNFIAHTSFRVNAGDKVPAGMAEFHFTPKLTVGIPR